MSYDYCYICRSIAPETWIRLQTADREDSTLLGEEFKQLYSQGNFVVLVAGLNLMLDEIYVFTAAADASSFYERAFIRRESVSFECESAETNFYNAPRRERQAMQGVTQYGFQEVSLYRNGKLVSTKTLPDLVPPVS